MKVLLPTNEVQCIKVRARTLDNLVKVKLRNEMLDEEIELVPSAGKCNGEFLMLELSHDFKEDENYEMRIENLDGEMIWRGKIFITSQSDLENYTVNHE